MSSAVVSATPHESCHATKEELRQDGLKSADGCPVCTALGSNCLVGCHPSIPSKYPSYQFLSIYHLLPFHFLISSFYSPSNFFLLVL